MGGFFGGDNGGASGFSIVPYGVNYFDVNNTNVESPFCQVFIPAASRILNFGGINLSCELVNSGSGGPVDITFTTYIDGNLIISTLVGAFADSPTSGVYTRNYPNVLLTNTALAFGSTCETIYRGSANFAAADAGRLGGFYDPTSTPLISGANSTLEYRVTFSVANPNISLLHPYIQIINFNDTNS